MNEQITKIEEELPNIKPVKEESKEVNEVKKEVINNLPTWSIEPPLKINRGQK